MPTLQTPHAVAQAVLANPLLQPLVAIARQTGQEVYVIGGFVRDSFLGLPSKDADVVVVGDALALARSYAQAVGASGVMEYGRFGTAMVQVNDWQLEFVGARRESYNPNSRKPHVLPGTLADDQLRRDFTLNALGISLSAHNTGELMDSFGGLQDLENGVLRTPTDPDVTFSDDPLRMLRAVRFACRFGFAIAPETFAGIARNAERLRILSMERVSGELNKVLACERPSVGFKLMFQAGLLPHIFPELQAMHGVDVREGVGHKDNFFHTLKVVDNLAATSPNLWLRWAALLHDIGKPRTKRYTPGQGWSFHGHDDLGARMVPKIFARLKLPQNEKMRYVQKLVQLHQRPIALASGEVTDSAIRRIVVDAGDDLEDLLTLCRADITTRDPRKHARYLENYAALENRIREVLERDALRNWQPPISGEDIMHTFGIGPSEKVGRIKNAIREAVLDGDIPNDPQAAHELMLRLGRELGLVPK
jgi:poly(A) polymerase